MISRLSVPLLLTVSALFPFTHAAVCRTDFPVEGCGLITYDNRTCDWVLANYEMIEGTCCSLSDYGNGGCRLTVDGPNNNCQVRMVGEFYPAMMIIMDTNNGTCPPTQYPKVVAPLCKSRNSTCSPQANECCEGSVCRARTVSNNTSTTQCLNCKKLSKPCLATSECCQGKCRRSSANSSSKKCRVCVKVNDKPCLDNGDCCNSKAKCVARASGGKVCKL